MTFPEAFGIPQLDHLLGTVPSASTVLLANDPGIPGEPFLYQATHHHLQAHRTVVYVAANRAPRRVREGMQAHGFEPSPRESERLVFLDAHSPRMGMREPGTQPIENPEDAEQLAAALEAATEKHPGAILVLDSLSTLLDGSTPEAFLPVLPRIEAALRRFALSLSLFTRWPYNDGILLATERFDALVRLRAVEGRVTRNQYFEVPRTAWATPPAPHAPRLYKVMNPGGVRVHLPKILVTGPYNAGKSTFIHHATGQAVSVDRLGTTVALDHGRAEIDGLVADVFGTPGQERFDPLLHNLAAQALGVILVVDATKPMSFPRARDMLDKTWRRGIPVLVAANKQDQPGALTPDQVAAHLALPHDVPVTGCIGRDPESCRKTLHTLVHRILTPTEAHP